MRPFVLLSGGPAGLDGTTVGPTALPWIDAPRVVRCVTEGEAPALLDRETDEPEEGEETHWYELTGGAFVDYRDGAGRDGPTLFYRFVRTGGERPEPTAELPWLDEGRLASEGCEGVGSGPTDEDEERAGAEQVALPGAGQEELFA